MHLLYSREKADKQLAVISCTESLRFNKKIDRHLGEITKKKAEGKMVVISDGAHGLSEVP